MCLIIKVPGGGGFGKILREGVHFYALGITAGTRAEQPGAVC